MSRPGLQKRQLAKMGSIDWLNGLYSRFTVWSRTPSFRLVLAAVASSLATTAGLLAFQTLQRKEHRRALRDSIESHFDGGSSRASLSRRSTRTYAEDDELQDYSDAAKAKSVRDRVELQKQEGTTEQRITVDEEIIREQLARNIAFLGEDAVNKIRNSFVIVVGMGGVGSAAATMLARSGVGKIRIIDFDQVSLSSLNRHSVANLADVGTSKVQCCKTHYERICPWIEIDAINELFSLEDAPRLLSGEPDWVVDCIDNIATKVDLLAFCSKNKLKVFSAMGAGGKYDPSRIQISDISMTFEDPLARAVRVKLKKAGVTSGIPVVYSTERPSSLGKLLPLPEEEFQKGSVGELSALEAFRVRILPVLGPLPCMFGQAAAAYLIAMLAGNVPIQPLPVKNRTKIYHRLFNDLSAREERLTGSNKIAINEEDCAYIFEELHRGRSVVAPSYAVPARPSMCRWNKDEPVTWENLVIFEKEEAVKHEQEVLVGNKKPSEVWNEDTCKLVEERRAQERKTRDFRLY